MWDFSSLRLLRREFDFLFYYIYKNCTEVLYTDDCASNSLEREKAVSLKLVFGNINQNEEEQRSFCRWVKSTRIKSMSLARRRPRRPQFWQCNFSREI